MRGGPPGAGQPFATGLSPADLSFFYGRALPEFSKTHTVSDGLGPRFDSDSCASCHSFPAVGGTSPPGNNPLVANAAIVAPGNTVPFFLTPDGPIREARFIRGANGQPDGNVHQLFTISGRSDSPPGCSIAQPDFSNRANLSFRIPLPLFGLGLINAIPDSTLAANLTSDPGGFKRRYGISGHFNLSGNDGTISRFGWKAQNKSTMLFAAEASNVELGVTNQVFPNETDENTACATNALPEDDMHPQASTAPPNMMALDMFLRMLDQPTPACGVQGKPDCSPDVIAGKQLFVTVGCALCHTPSLATGRSTIPTVDRKQANLYSDLALHDMGKGLADNITQGAAGPSEFCTPPLWGVGQRAFFLHDGRASDLLTAILDHSSPGSEARAVIDAFQRLSVSQQQDILNFLRSL